ncbi:hypothetical protein ACFV2X_40060 [Streptomyces sp. NPDC059679]|uniref:EamA family transporter n=1 Tax=Streptomyces sp. NPDC059679 TaxID=3346903 RepID=UPI0036B007A8
MAKEQAPEGSRGADGEDGGAGDGCSASRRSSVRFLTAGLLLWGLAERRHEPRLTALRWRRATLVGVLLFSVGMGGVALAEEYVDSGTTALFIATIPLWSVLLNTAGGRPSVTPCRPPPRHFRYCSGVHGACPRSW